MDKEQKENRKKVIYELICSEDYVPMKRKEIAMLLSISGEEKEDLKEVLEELTSEGKIDVSAKGKYTKSDGNRMTGTYLATSKGFGFVKVEGMEEDIFISESDNHGALHNDKVSLIIKSGKHGRRKEGVVTKILSHGMTEIVGTFEKSKNFGFVTPDNARFNKDIYVSLERSKGAVSGHKVVVEITDFGDGKKNPEGIVKEIIGHINDPGTDIMSIVKGYQLPTEFPKEVMKYVESIPEIVLQEDMAGRMDVRDWQMVTIDGEDAKDLDDAITLTKEQDIYRLGVHIADVTNYVVENSVLDKDALNRGTSVYLVDRVIPMLPHKLSNGICSLNAGVDRLALSCIMDIDSKGNIINHKVAETIVRVDRRMSYTSVKKILVDNDEQEIKEYEALVPMFQLMRELAQIMNQKRRKRGSIDFDFPEAKILLDEKGHPLEIKPYERNVATRIIEEFMLAANETIAQDYFWQELPFVYRTHDNPDPEKMLKLSTFINNFGYTILLKDEIHPKELQKLLGKIEGSEEEMLISRLTLRSMKQARYTTDCSGHFGLAAQYYCHFTSPIRRYPDLQIHRIIKENLRGKMSAKRVEHYEKILPEVSSHSSDMERRADEAERETQKLKKAEYMKQFIGQTFEGVISSITSWGMYVELPNTVEGMVHVTALKDGYYYYDEEHYEMRAENSNKVFKLGQKLMIEVESVDLFQKSIDFVLAETTEEKFEQESAVRREHADSEGKKSTQRKKSDVEERKTARRKKTDVEKRTTVRGKTADAGKKSDKGFEQKKSKEKKTTTAKKKSTEKKPVDKRRSKGKE